MCDKFIFISFLKLKPVQQIFSQKYIPKITHCQKWFCEVDIPLSWLYLRMNNSKFRRLKIWYLKHLDLKRGN